MRRRFARRIEPDTRIESVLLLRRRRGPYQRDNRSVLARYIDRYGLTNTLGSYRLLGDQWLVLTEHRFLLFACRGGGFARRVGGLEHALHRTEVELQWADFTEGGRRKRLVQLITSDHRMNIAETIIANDEPDLLVQATADRARQIGLQEL